jgi:hypothetical protein
MSIETGPRIPDRLTTITNGELAFDCPSQAEYDTLTDVVTFRGEEYRKRALIGTQAHYTLAKPADAAPPPEEAARRLTFDQAALQTLREAAQVVFNRHPEVRSAMVVLDYAGPLNDTPGVHKAVWLSARGGQVTEIPAVFGTAQNLLAALDVVLTQAARTEDKLRGLALEHMKTLAQERSTQPSEPPTAPPADAAAGRPAGGDPGGVGDALAAGHRRVAAARGGGVPGDGPGPV